MTFSYDLTALASDPVSRLRLEIGDTTENEPSHILEDEEIQFVYDDEAENILMASERLLEMILARIAQDTDSSGAGLTSSRTQRTNHFKDCLERVQKRIVQGASVRFTGNSVTVLDELKEDDDARELLTELRRNRRDGG